MGLKKWWRGHAWVAAGLLGAAGLVGADPFPPTLGNGAAHFPAVDWPAEPTNPLNCGAQCGDWQPYTRFQSGVADPRVQDPSNGGTAPQNYVNISSSCVDKSYPSIYYALRAGAAADGSQDVIMFRWRVEQIANTYATGPSAGAYGASDPWSSALWSVLFDVDGDGYLDLAAHLDGSSGAPAMSIDRIAGIWSKRPTQSLDYLGDPTNVKLLAHNPTAFVDPGTGRLLNFGSRNAQNQPQANWPNGSAETVWDYGTSRAKRVTNSPCNEYFIDYQIPVQMLDASSQGGPRVTRSTPISMLFCTANSLNNPFQKDCAINARWTGTGAQAGPFGDYISFNQPAPYAQPIVSRVEAVPPNTCPGNYTLTATVQDTLAVQNGGVVPSVQAVRFYYYNDVNANGIADDGQAWTWAADAALKPGSLNTWSASWSGAGLPKGSYLIGVQALDDNTRVDLDVTPSGVNNRTFSYVAGDAQNRIQVDGQNYAPVPVHSPVMTAVQGENWWGNPSVTGSQVALVGLALNSCGVAPTLTKTASVANVAAGGTVDYTFTVSNTLGQPLGLTNIQDVLPAGFSVMGTTPGSLAPTSSPMAGATGTVVWGFAPAVTLAPGASGSFAFRAQATPLAGQYNNTATADTSFGTLASAPVPIAVDGARLSFSKTPGSFQAVADGNTPLVYTLRYANDSAVAVTGARIADTLPAGMAFVSCSGGTACGLSGGTVAWTLGTLAGGASGTVQLTVTVNGGYSGSSLANTATLEGLDPAGAPVSQSASATVAVPVSAVPAPAFSLTKTASAAQVAPGGTLVWTLNYSNYGTAGATGVTLSDTLPPGFSYVSCTGGCSASGNAVSWNLGPVAAGGSGSVTVTAVAANPFTAFNPATNTASLTWSGNTGSPVTASVQAGVTGQSCSKYYFRNIQLNVGAGAATQLIANQASSDPTGAGATKLVTVPASSGGFATALEFYTDPVTASSVDFNGAITSYIYVDRANGPGLVVKTEVFDYNPATGALTPVGTASQITMNGSTKGLVQDTSNKPPTFAATGTLQKGHRLLFRYSVSSANSQTYNVYFQYDGNTVANPISGGTATNAPSRGEFCVTPPANLAFRKTVDSASVTAGVQTPVQYTLSFANTGQAKATGVQIVDTLPTGVSFVSATLNGGAIAPVLSGQQLTFTGVHSSSDAVAGEVSGGTSGVLMINALVAASATGALTNNASISSTQTEPAAANVTTFVQDSGGGGTPALAVQVAANRTSSVPGDTVTYTVTVANIGTGSASSVVLTNPLPALSYYTYGACSDGCVLAGGSLQWSIPSLAVGASASYTFTMVVGSSGLSAGVTVVPDSASASASSVAAVGSNVVNVSISGNPVLALAKTVSGPASPAPGQTLRYTLQVSNSGSTAAEGVAVSDPIPAGVRYTGALQASVGSGVFDAINNRVLFDVGSLAAGASASLSFEVAVAALPSGSTLVTNTATVSARNAASRSASASVTAVAQPLLTLTKQAPQQIAFPAATVSQPVVNGTVVRVNDSSQLRVGQYIGLGGSVVQVADLSPATVTVASPVTVAAGALVQAAVEYTLTYQNTGSATAADVVIADTLPAGMAFVAASQGGTLSGGRVLWSIGALDPQAGGSVQLVLLPSAAGTYVNQASAECSTCTAALASASTSAGGLMVAKRTTTPTVAVGGLAEYVIDVQNTSASALGGVSVTDVLSPGFAYESTVAVLHDGAPVPPATTAPAVGDGALAWGSFTVQGGKTLSLRFTARVSAAAGTATYQNEAGATPVERTVAYDFLRSTTEDVVVLGADSGLISGAVFHDVDNNGAYDPAIDLPLQGLTVRFLDGSGGIVYEEVTDAAGAFARVVPLGTWSVQVVGSGVPGGLSLGGSFSNPLAVTVGPAQSVRADMGYVNTLELPDLTLTKTHTGSFAQGQAAAQYQLVVSNLGQGATAAAVTVTDTLPAGLVATAMSGTGWNCTLAIQTCTRSDVLAAGASYPAITLVVAVAPNAAAQVTNTAAVSGGGEVNTANNSASDPTTITAVQLTPDLALTKSHSGNFVQGQTGATYTIAVRNAGSGPTVGTVTVADQLPAGLTATALSGSGWSCDLATLRCTRSDALAPGAQYPAITVVVNVAAMASASLTNVATVSGGGDVTPANNSASDATAITSCACVVGGHVFMDRNGDGLQQAGEENFANVQITLQEQSAPTQRQLRMKALGSWTVTTDANGDFAAALPGVSSVKIFIAPPPGYALTTGNDGQALTVGQPLALALPMGLIPAAPAGATGIPAVGPWALALLSFLVGLLGLRGRCYGTAAAARRAR